MDTIGLLLVVWLTHVGIALALTAPIIYAGRHRVHWRWWELLVLVIPFVEWAVLMMVDSTGKSLSNVGEPNLFAPAVPLAALVRVVLGRAADEKITAACLVVSVTAVAAAVYWFMPGLPE